jgi:hypothetical protein
MASIPRTERRAAQPALSLRPTGPLPPVAQQADSERRGPVEISRPYYWFPTCHTGQCPADRELDIENTELSLGVRRMQALVGQQVPFDGGREQMKILADLEVTAKSVERTAEAIGADVAQRQQKAIQQALQLNLPALADKSIPILYVQMDGTGRPESPW